jgi:drug/metabolite transporter (DMT)-like permease
MTDLRFPIGLFFAILGVILLATPGMHARLSDAPVNLYSGTSMLIFGAAMLWLALRHRGDGGGS